MRRPAGRHARDARHGSTRRLRLDRWASTRRPRASSSSVDQRRPRRHLRRAATRAGSCSSPDAIPGERVLARITDDAQDRASGAPRPSRCSSRQPAPPAARLGRGRRVERDPADRAGGAEFGHIELGAPARAEAARCSPTRSQRMAASSVDVEVEVEALARRRRTTAPGWRTRVRLHVDDDGAVGPYAARSHTRRSRSPTCRSPSPALRAVAPLDERFPGAPARRRPRPDASATRALVVVEASRAAGPRRSSRARRRPRVPRSTTRGFWQVHRGAAATLTRAVQDAVDADLFDPRAANLDLYGGVGLLAAAVGDRFGDDRAHHDRRVRRARHRARRREPRRLARGAAPSPPGSTAACDELAARGRRAERARLARRDRRARPAALGRRPGGRRRARRARARASSSTSPAIPSRSPATSALLARARLRARRPARVRPVPEHAPRRGGRLDALTALSCRRRSASDGGARW